MEIYKDPTFAAAHHQFVLPPSVGLGGIYQGLTATILKQGSNQAIRFFVYSWLKKWFQGGDNSKDIGPLKTMFCGGLAGAASVFGNTPIDVIKTRMQVQQCVCMCGVVWYVWYVVCGI